MKYISVYGGSRMSNVHFKDMKSEPQGAICPCGTGTIDMKAAYDACVAAGVKSAQVEQDNAPDSGDAIGEMKTKLCKSCADIRQISKRSKCRGPE